MPGPVRYHLGGFPPTGIDWESLVSLIGQANAAIARYDGLVAAIPNAAVLLSPLTTQEAVLSSRIEGTNVTMGEVLEIEAGAGGEIEQPKRDDVEEIRNYRRALGVSAKVVEDRPLTPHLLREAHMLLMDGVRGRNKDPGHSGTSRTGSVTLAARWTKPATCRYHRPTCWLDSTRGQHTSRRDRSRIPWSSLRSRTQSSRPCIRSRMAMAVLDG